MNYRILIKNPINQTLWFTILFLILFILVGEWIARQEFFQSLLTPPNMGSRHYQLGHKLALLDTVVKHAGPVDCIMIGSSIVDGGVNPEYFQEGYTKITGNDIRCFNFGIDASTAVSTSALANILIEDYQPRLLIFGTDARDYAVSLSDKDPVVILETPWVKYRQGYFSLEGWLLQHSYLYRYRKHLGRLFHFNFENTILSHTTSMFDILPNGFSPKYIVATYVNNPPDPRDKSFEVVYNTQLFSSFRMLEENIVALNKITSYNKTGTQVVIVEMPMADGLYYFFENGEEDYKQYVASLDELISRTDATFLHTMSSVLIPDDAWLDYSHLNAKGAEIFSVWLGEQVGYVEKQGLIEIITP